MTETLFIRLGSQAHDTIHWLVVAEAATNQQEIIGSGQLNGTQQLSELTSKAETRQVKVLVPSCDVLLKSLNVPAKSDRAMKLAAPYMLEDNLAEDVEQLFFAYADLPSNDQEHNCFTAILAHSQMQQWLFWLAEANIKTAHLLPDVLAMPLVVGDWSAIALGDLNQEQVIVRQDIWCGFTVDASTWQLQCEIASQQTEQSSDVIINAYSPLAFTENVTVNNMPEELPLALLAKHYASETKHFNLLQGQYKIKEKRHHATKQWLWVAGIAAFALLLNLGHKSMQLWQLNKQHEAITQNIIAHYKDAFPKTKRVRIATIKSQLNRELAKLGGINDQAGFLVMLAKLQPAFAKVPSLKPDSLKFDAKRQELRIQASAKNYQDFEMFTRVLEAENLAVKQGSQNNQGDQVVGSFSISYANMKKSTNQKSRKRTNNKRALTNKYSKNRHKETS